MIGGVVFFAAVVVICNGLSVGVVPRNAPRVPLICGRKAVLFVGLGRGGAARLTCANWNMSFAAFPLAILAGSTNPPTTLRCSCVRSPNCVIPEGVFTKLALTGFNNPVTCRMFASILEIGLISIAFTPPIVISALPFGGLPNRCTPAFCNCLNRISLAFVGAFANKSMSSGTIPTLLGKTALPPSITSFSVCKNLRNTGTASFGNRSAASTGSSTAPKLLAIGLVCPNSSATVFLFDNGNF